MNRNAFSASLALALAFAPAPAAAQEAVAILKRAAQAMGASDLKTLRYAGAGTGASFGQAYSPGMHWPRLNLAEYERQIDYTLGASTETLARSRAEPRGGGAVPLSGVARATGAVSGQLAWNVAGPGAAPRQAALIERQHDLWITPHGVVMAGLKHDAKLAWKRVGKRELAAASFTVPGVMRATAYINDRYLVERVESVVPDNVLGDTQVVTEYSDYQDRGGIKFPMRIRQSKGGHPVLDVAIKDVQPNTALELAVPGNVAAASGGERVVAEKAAEGVWYLAGGSHHSVAIEMKDHLIVVESPLGDGRAQAMFAEAKKLVPGKPVRYVVNSHNHFDHSGGLRAAVAEGATLVVQERARPYWQKVLANPSRIAPDALAKSGRKAKLLGVGAKRVLTDGSRTVEIHHIPDKLHVATFLMVYLPKERLLIEADAFTPGPPKARPASPANPYHVNLAGTVERLKLDVDRILPLHGRIVPLAELHRAVGRN